MVRHCLAYAAVFVSAIAASSPARSEPRAVLELFTSQGCSSCPAADKLLGEFTRDRSLLSISVPIDYWDYLGWKDTLAEPRNSARQKGYALMRGDGRIYTPQIVVNGTAHALGSDKAAVEHAIRKSRQNGASPSLPLTLAIADGQVSVGAPDGVPPHGGAEVWACGIANAITVAIGRGENKGRAITYHNVVRRWIKLGEWTGMAGAWSVPLKSLEGGGIDAVAILVQGGTREKPRAILGATLAAIK